MAVHFAFSLASRILGQFAGLFVRLLDRDLLLPLTVAEDLFNELLLRAVPDHSLHLISRQLRSQHCLNAHGGMWTVDDEVATSVELSAEHRFVLLRFHSDGAPKAANGLRVTCNE